MGIEEEIKQANFKNDYEKLLINQLFTGKWVGDLVFQHLKPFGLTSQQYNVLRILRGQEEKALSINSILERMIDKMSNVSRLIDKLKAKKLVQRKINAIDRRQVDIEITQAGLTLLSEIDKQGEMLHAKLKNLDPAEAKQLNDLLDKLRG